MAEEAKEEATEKKGGGKGIIIILLVVMILLIIGIGVLTFFLLTSKNHEGGGDSAAAEQHASAEHGDAKEEVKDGIVRSYSPKYKQYDPPEPGAAPQYFAMEPFVVNFKGQGQAKFLAVTIKFMTHYPQLVKDMENYRPMLRNDITAMLRIQTYTELNQDNGQQVLADKILKIAKADLEKNNIYPDLLEAVYFDRFVMQ
ncbi:flagellar basal body-associated protein FliL [Hydrogenovibrio sp. JE_KL2]|uniref:flagellar basal body-associated FliL family protein n=1 Tax=Hydrogenovibrio sp. JE_KL2 TaxID=2651188 RepID=UPI00128B9CC0|nr:flagellar basal body-associated FliL family protein [Hydrogenovibrio sp. JE_KL2]MPQ76249.1 flagellar basal body-associated FliL family protein [Hydrogenovibrio sp. JE_KL2]